jgi:hypothetical protein
VTNILRLKEGWLEEYKAWEKWDLSRKHYVFISVDGIYFNVRLREIPQLNLNGFVA